jgi:single-strand DNA-binding protein
VAGVNRVFLIGNLGKDPEVRYTQSGKAVCNFSIAVTEGPRDKEKTEWFNVVAFDEAAESCGKFLSKGRQVCVEGRIQTREWEDKEGAKRRSVEVVSSRVAFLGKPEKNIGDEPPTGPAPKREVVDDDLPF